MATGGHSAVDIDRVNHSLEPLRAANPTDYGDHSYRHSRSADGGPVPHCHSPLPKPTPTPSVPTEIEVGVYVKVLGAEGDQLSFRTGPGLNYARLKLVDDGTILKVVEGDDEDVPVEADGLTWWRLEDPSEEDADLKVGWGGRRVAGANSAMMVSQTTWAGDHGRRI